MDGKWGKNEQASRKDELPSKGLLLRSDNGLIFGSKPFVRVAKEYGIDQEKIRSISQYFLGNMSRLLMSLKRLFKWW